MTIESARAVIYARFSSNNQREESIDAQIRSINEYAKQKNITISKIYVDRAKTATSDKRPQFQQMIKDSQTNDFGMVLVHKLDRFARNTYDSAVYKRKLELNGVRVVSVTEPLDDSPMSKVVESVLEALAEYHSSNLAGEVMKGMKETAYQCKHTGGQPPYGFDVGSDKRLVINEEEAQAVRLMFQMYADGHGYGDIINELNLRGHRTRAGRTFGKNSLYGLLENEKYKGCFVFNKSSSKDSNNKRNSHKYKDNSEIIRIPNGCPAIISEELFDIVQDKKRLNKSRGGRYNAKEIYMLSGLIYCGHCNSAMCGSRKYSGRNKTKHVTYRCCKRTQNLTCKTKEINRDSLENYVLHELENKVFNDKIIPVLVHKIKSYLDENKKHEAKRIDKINANIRETESKIEKLISAIESIGLDENLTHRLKQLQEEKSSLIATLDTHMKSVDIPVIDEEIIRKTIKQFKTYIKNRNVPECHKLIEKYVKHVYIYNDHIELTLNVAFLICADISETVSIDRKVMMKMFKAECRPP